MRPRQKTRSPLRCVAALVLTAGLSAPALAEVTSLDGNGFSVTLKQELTGVSSQDAWALMTRRVSTWWDAAHTWGGDASQLKLEAKANGCFCEWLPNGGWAEHLKVIHVAPGRVLRMRGALGPLMQMGLEGTMTWSLQPLDDGSGSGSTTGLAIEWQYIVSGHRPEGFDDIAPAVDAVLGEQLDRLVKRMTGAP